MNDSHYRIILMTMTNLATLDTPVGQAVRNCSVGELQELARTLASMQTEIGYTPVPPPPVLVPDGDDVATTRVVAILKEAEDHALPVRKIMTRTKMSRPIVKAALRRLKTTGRIKMLGEHWEARWRLMA